MGLLGIAPIGIFVYPIQSPLATKTGKATFPLPLVAIKEDDLYLEIN